MSGGNPQPAKKSGKKSRRRGSITPRGSITAHLSRLKPSLSTANIVGEGASSQGAASESSGCPQHSKTEQDANNSSLTSEIKESNWSESRERLRLVVERPRRSFGASCNFSVFDGLKGEPLIWNPNPREVPVNDLEVQEGDVGVQLVLNYVDSGTQTNVAVSRNSAVQYEFRQLEAMSGAGDAERSLQSDSGSGLATFLEAASLRMENELLQTDLFDLMSPDWNNLVDTSKPLKKRIDATLKDYQTYSAVKCRNRPVTHIAFHPTIKTLFGCSHGDGLDFNDRVNSIALLESEPRFVLLWHIQEPVLPMLLLESPEEVTIFDFCPQQSGVVVAGCLDGKLVLWDVTSHIPRIKSRRKAPPKVNSLNTKEGFVDESRNLCPLVLMAARSFEGHSSPIRDFIWLNPNESYGKLKKAKPPMARLLTAAASDKLHVWDVTQPEPQPKRANPLKPSVAFRKLDNKWAPCGSVVVTSKERSIVHEKWLKILTEIPDLIVSEMGTKYSAVTKICALKDSRFLLGTEEGRLAEIKFDPSETEIDPVYETMETCSHVISLQPSPFLDHLVLSAGQLTFSIWEVGSKRPVLDSRLHEAKISAACWSLSRPCVFFISRHDGVVDIWDVSESSHEPIASQKIGDCRLTTMKVKRVSSQQQLVCLGDAQGTTYFMLVPDALRVPLEDEINTCRAFFQRESARLDAAEKRREIREEETQRRRLDRAHLDVFQSAGSVADEAARELQAQEQFEQYLEEEYRLQQLLGIYREDDFADNQSSPPTPRLQGEPAPADVGA